MNSLTHILCFFLILASAGYAQKVTLIGKHYDADSNKLLYIEKIELNQVNKIRYNDVYQFTFPSGKKLGELKTSKSDSAQRPSYEFTDFRDRRVEGVNFRPNGNYNIFIQRSEKVTRKTKSFKLTPSVVTIPGINNFMTLNLKKILAKKPVKFTVALPTETDNFAFTMNYNKRLRYQGQDCVKVKMTTTNPVLRLFLRPIYITYSLKSGLVLEYQGIYYIRNPNTGWKGHYVIAKYKKR